MNRVNLHSAAEKLVSGSETDFSKHGIGIVHFGPGAFHRAHQAVYTHEALKKHGGDWRILGVSLQSTDAADQLNAQNGIYTLVERGDEEPTFKLIKSLAKVEAASRDKEPILEALGAETTRIVSMTVTEKAYGVIRSTGQVDPAHPAIAHDLDAPDNPIGVIGFLVKGLKNRKAKGLPPFTVLCCDNLPQNGDLVRSGVLGFTKRIGEDELADWISKEGAFPNTMVDRITPATKPKLVKEVSKYIGFEDLRPVETEPFCQWVVEDRFTNGRPKWEEVGVLFVDDVEPFEEMKLRMLNGAHSFIAYMGFLSGKKYVRDVMANESMAQMVDKHISAASETLRPLEGIDFDAYRRQLVERFKNRNIAHETYQIAMDGSQKMPQRVFAPAVDALTEDKSIEPFALATAFWMRYCSGVQDDGQTYDLRDPRSSELKYAFDQGSDDAEQICGAFFMIPDLFPETLLSNELWVRSVTNHLDRIINLGVEKAILRT